MIDRPVIHSLQNPKIKMAGKLRDASCRRKLGKFLVDGEDEIRRAAENRFKIETLFVTDAEPWLDCFPVSTVLVTTSEALSHISYGQRGSSPVAIFSTPAFRLDQLSITERSLLLVLDRTEKPGNLGACLRTAAACAVQGVVLIDPVCEVMNPNTIRASRGAVFSVPVAIATRAELLRACRMGGLSLFAARIDGTSQLWNIDFKGGAAIVFGSEATGLGKEWDQEGIASFVIPMDSSTDSLNLSNSAAIVLYEAMRQRARG